MRKIEPGKYLAKIKDYAMSETSTGHPQVVITFNFLANDGIKEEFEGQPRLKIKWINLPSTKISNRLTMKEAKNKFRDLNIQAELARRRDLFEL